MNEKEAIAKFSKPNTWVWLLSLVLDWAGVAAALYVTKTIDHWSIYLLSVPFIGMRFHAIVILGHDGAHYHISRKRKLNDFLANTFCFLPFGYHLNSYRKWHLTHHQYLGSDKDSENLTIKKWMDFRWKLPLGKKHIIARSLFGLIGLEAYDTLVAGYLFRPITLVENMTNLAFLLCAGFAIYYLKLTWILPIIGAAAFLILPVLNYLRTLFEHTGSKSTLRLKLNWLERFVLSPHNILSHHYEHHKWPSIPFYNLHHVRFLDKETPIYTLSEQITIFEKFNSDVDEMKRAS